MSTASDPDRPFPNSYWVAPGRLAAGEYPGDLHHSKASEKLVGLLEAGVNYFIDLTEEGEHSNLGRLESYIGIAEEIAGRQGRTVEWARHPIRDATVPRSPEQMSDILDAIDTQLAEGKTVYVHCWGGVGRTGTVVGCWLVRHGSTGREALDEVAALWQGVEKIDRQPKSPGQPDQRDYVRNWRKPK